MELELFQDPVHLTIGEQTLEVTPIGEGVFRFALKDTVKIIAVEGDRARIRVMPAYLDRPVLLQFDPPIALAPRGRAEMFVILRMGVEVVLLENGDSASVFHVLPPGLRRAWFGDMESGVLVYAFPATPVEDPSQASRDPFTVLLPLSIRSEDRNPHDLLQLLVDTPQLSIYENREGVRFAEVVEVILNEDRMEIRYTDRPPERDLVEIRKGLESANLLGFDRLARRTLSRWKQILKPFDPFGN